VQLKQSDEAARGTLTSPAPALAPASAQDTLQSHRGHPRGCSWCSDMVRSQGPSPAAGPSPSPRPASSFSRSAMRARCGNSSDPGSTGAEAELPMPRGKGPGYGPRPPWPGTPLGKPADGGMGAGAPGCPEELGPRPLAESDPGLELAYPG